MAIIPCMLVLTLADAPRIGFAWLRGRDSKRRADAETERRAPRGWAGGQAFRWRRKARKRRTFVQISAESAGLILQAASMAGRARGQRRITPIHAGDPHRRKRVARLARWRISLLARR